MTLTIDYSEVSNHFISVTDAAKMLAGAVKGRIHHDTVSQKISIITSGLKEMEKAVKELRKIVWNNQ